MIVYFIILSLLVINIYLNSKIKFYFFSKGIFLSEKKQYFYSYIYCVIFLLVFVIGFRFLRIFFIENSYLDLNIIFSILEKAVENYTLNNILILTIIIFFFFFTLRKSIIYITKYNFLRVIYLMNIKHFSKIHKIALLDEKVLSFFHKYLAKILVFTLSYGFKLIFIFFFLKGVIFNHGLIYIGFLPWYALYYFWYNVFSNLKKLNFEFDYVSLYIYKGLGCSLDCWYKIKEYHTYLILGYSDYEFYYVSDFFFKKNKTKNSLILEKNKDFFINTQ